MSYCVQHALERVQLDVNVPRGFDPAEKLMLPGQGHCIPDVDAGDVAVEVSVSPHATVQRRGDNLLVEKDISLLESLCGCNFTFTHFDGRVLQVRSDRGEVIGPNSMKCIENEGMPLAVNPFLKVRCFVAGFRILLTRETGL